MSIKDDHLLTPPVKKLRFRGDLNLHYFDQRIEEVWDDGDRDRAQQQNHNNKGTSLIILFGFKKQ